MNNELPMASKDVSPRNRKDSHLFRMIRLGLLILLGGLVWLVTRSFMVSIFIEAPNRSAASGVRADLREMGQAIARYRADHGTFPVAISMEYFVEHPEDRRRVRAIGLTTVHPGGGGVAGLTTPVAYLPQLMNDRFTSGTQWPYAYSIGTYKRKTRQGVKECQWWAGYSTGPDRDYDISDPAKIYDPAEEKHLEAFFTEVYNQNNGVLSSGDIFRLGR